MFLLHVPELERLRCTSRMTALIPGDYDSLFQSPLVIAMPAPIAPALAYPGLASPRALSDPPALRTFPKHAPVDSSKPC